MHRFYFLLLLAVFTISTSLSAQKPVTSSKLRKGEQLIKVDPIVCYSTNEVNHHYVPPVARSRSSNLPGLTFNATYSPGTPQEVKNIFEDFIFPTLNETFSSNLPVNVEVVWGTTENESTLAAAGPSTLFRGSIALPFQQSWYPVALAEKILNRDVNDPGEPDINVLINSAQDWYFNYNSPGGIGNRFDLASTLLHEMYHGLGFVVARDVDDDDNGFLLFFDDPYHFARYMEDTEGNSLLDLQEGSPELGTALTNSQVFFGSPSFESNTRPRLYAPFIYSQGSSIAHLDELTYNNTASSLMTPNSARGEIERSAGISDDLMYDMGWNYTSIVYEQPEPEENVDSPFEVVASIVSDNEVNESSMTLHYFENGTGEEMTMTMTKGDDGMFRAQIPGTGQERFVLYYLSVEDAASRIFVNPGESPAKNLYRYDFAIDDTAPEITHDPVLDISTVDNSFDLVADITDFFTGLETVQVEYAINKQLQNPIDMVFESLNEFTEPVYQATVDLPSGALTETDILEYRIVAIDKANASNRTTSPANGFYTVAVNPISATIDDYGNDFNRESDDFFEDGFSVTTPTGFIDPAIHSQHPYPNAGENMTIDWTYELKFPVKIGSSDPTIRFDEIVLVENGEPGTAFGETEFWDYVIVEGKRLGERDWLPFLDGYDCRANPVWLNTYLGGIPNDNSSDDSSAEGTPQLFRGRTIDMTANGNFAVGDEIFIRFRMFSDPFAVGWGWAVDNVRVQRTTVAVEDFVEQSNFIVYPNPVLNNEINIAIDLKKNAPNTQLTITNLFGQVVHREALNLQKNASVHSLDASQLPQGVYLVSLQFNKEDIITRKIVK